MDVGNRSSSSSRVGGFLLAKFKASHKFKGVHEKKTFEANKEIELTVKRAEEIQENIRKQKGFEEFTLERLDK